MQQKGISVTQNPQNDILETHGGCLIAYFEKYSTLRLISKIYCLKPVEIEFVKALWYEIIFLTLCEFKRYA